jgi:hypothetical protein
MPGRQAPVDPEPPAPTAGATEMHRQSNLQSAVTTRGALFLRPERAFCGQRGALYSPLFGGLVKIRHADRQQAAGGDEQNFEADNVRPHGDGKKERPHGGSSERSLVLGGLGVTALCFRRQQQHFIRFPGGRILKVKIWLKCATNSCWAGAKRSALVRRPKNLVAAIGVRSGLSVQVKLLLSGILRLGSRRVSSTVKQTGLAMRFR